MKLIPLTQGKSAKVDDSDYEWLSKWKWNADRRKSGKWYARRSYYVNGKRLKAYMHVEIMSPARGLDIDHIDGDGCNNQRFNMRVVQHQQNTWNQKKRSNNVSGYKGVSWYNPSRKWRACIVVDARQIHLGYYFDVLEAAKSYDQAASLYHGAYALLNFPKT